MDTGMGHGIENRIIAFVSDTRDNRQRKLRTGSREQISIKSGKIGSCPTAPDNNYYIKTVRTGIYLIQSRQNGFFNTITLHQCRKKFRIEVKTSRIILQLVAKITVSGSGWLLITIFR